MLPMAFPTLSYPLLSKISISLVLVSNILQLVSGQCLQDEQRYLFRAFPNSSRPQSWSLDTDCCHGWKGVRCDNTTGHVTHLDLSSNKFQSPIPTSLFRLSKLTHLNLSYSAFTDEIPREIHLLNNLTVLDLRGNQLQGTIPLSLFTLPSLQLLLLGYNRFQGEMQKFLHFSPSLKVVDLSYNNLEGPIPGIGMKNSFHSEVTYPASHNNSNISLLLSNNRFSGGIPPSICNSRNLQVLDLSNNNLSGQISQCLSKLSTVLTVANLRNNNFTGHSPDFATTNCNLRTLNLNGNRLEGAIPKSISKCQELEVLDMGNNRLAGPFPDYGEILPKLRVLVLRSNNLIGSLDNPVGSSFPLIQIIDISSNNFSGLLASVANLKGMISGEDETEPGPYLEIVRYKVFEGLYYQDSVAVVSKGLVMELVKILTIFKSVDVSNNKFQGEIPQEIGMLNMLRVLNMSHNELRGQIPQSILNLTLLESLDLSQNDLSGNIPQQMTNLTFLSVLNLSYNHLSGRIPYARQFLTFSSESFVGNSGLCGPPLSVDCGDAIAAAPDGNEDLSSNGPDWKLISEELGYIVGLATFFGPLLIWRRWRRFYSKQVDAMLAYLHNYFIGSRYKMGREVMRQNNVV